MIQEKIDVAYAMYEYSASFTGTSAKLFKKTEYDELAENFIVTKGLQAFLHHGIILKV